MITPLGADIIIAVQFLIGAAAGLLIGLVTLRSQLTWRTGLVIASVTGIVLEIAVGTVSWASFHKDIRWLNLIADHFPFIVGTATIAAAVITSALVKAAGTRTAAKIEGNL